jgi:serpin B
MHRASLLGLVVPLALGARPVLASEPQWPVPPEIVAANTAFAADLYGALAKAPGNAVFSPFSISAAFAMAREGARGETAAEMDRVLHLPKSAGAMYAALLDTLNAPRYVAMGEQKVRSYELAVANGLFGSRAGQIKDEFRRTLADSFGAEMATLDFTKPDAARATINRWVEQKTREKIKDLIPPGQPAPDTRLVLANAVYFKAAWRDAFKAYNTKNGPFHAPGGDVTAPLMRQTDDFGYAETADAQVLEMSYLNGDTSMFVVLPRAVDGLPALEKTVTAASLGAWLKAVQSTEVDVVFPKFKQTVAFDLGDAMKGLGMRLAFDDLKADFTGIAEKPTPYISSALHKAFIGVDEEGTEAAAATVVTMAPTSAAPGAAPKPKSFVADHPFLYGIRHRATGSILFLGRVVDPTK